MFGLFSRPRRKSSQSQTPSFRPTLERLECRDCPSTISLSVIAYYGQNRMVGFVGKVTNTPTLGGLAVHLGGVVNGTTTTGSDGSFSVTLTASGPGAVTAATTDGQSNTAQVAVSDPSPPKIDSYSWAEYPGNMYVFGGHVVNGYEGEVVHLGGLNSLNGVTAVCGADGSFSVVVQLDGHLDDSGWATAQTTDGWGTQSSAAKCWVAPLLG